jgi:hypothetical protein
MASLELLHDAFGHMFTKLFMCKVGVTVERRRVDRQDASFVTGRLCFGPEDSVVVTGKMSVQEREAVKASRTCKQLLGLYNTLYNEHRKSELHQGLWDVFVGIVVREVLAMERRTSRNFFLVFAWDMLHLCVCAEHQEMQAQHGLTGAAVLDASGAQAWAGVQPRIAVHFTAMGKLEVLQPNLAAAGKRDSRTDLLMGWLEARYAAFLLGMEEVSVLEHP